MSPLAHISLHASAGQRGWSLQITRGGKALVPPPPPVNITQDLVDEAKQILHTCRQHKEGLAKTLQKAKVFEKMFSKVLVLERMLWNGFCQ